MKNTIIFILVLLFSGNAIAQNNLRVAKTKNHTIGNKIKKLNYSLVVDTSYSPVDLVNDFFNGTCVQVSNVNFKGDPSQCGFFWADQTSLGVPAGIILATGDVLNALGPNNEPGIGSSTGSGSDADLMSLSSAPIFDASVLEFDFISDKPHISINYIFGSEEYEEYTCSNFNDVFGFFITGPGVNQNVALIPSTNIPVRINTINQGSPGANGNIDNCTSPLGSLNYSAYYKSNPVDSLKSIEIEYDGYTVPLSAEIYVTPGETYHAKMAIGDTGDAIYDSGVLIGINSFCADSLLNPKIVNASIEPAGTGQYNFKSNIKYATAFDWDFGDKTHSSLKNPGIHKYNQEGNYKVTCVASNYCCSDTMKIDLNVSFKAQIVNIGQSQPTCHDLCNGSISMQVYGGKAPYVYHWSNGMTTQNIYGLCAGIYGLTVTDADGYHSYSSVELTQPDPVEVKVFQTAPGENSAITTYAIPKGGTPPYTYQWADGSIEKTRKDLKQGQGYALKVFDSNGCLVELAKQGTKGGTIKYNPAIGVKIVARELSINAANIDKSKADISVFDAMGKSMFKKQIEGDQSIQLNTSSWPGGIYYIQMVCDREVVQKSVFIK